MRAELAAAGFDFSTVSDLRTSRRRYSAAVPILMKWLPLLTSVAERDEVVRALSVPWARPLAARLMVDEFRRAAESGEWGLAWAIGNALEIVADDSVFDDLVLLVSDPHFGVSRQMIVLALGRSKRSDAVSTLVPLLTDADVSGHAVMALGKLRAKEAAEAVRPFLGDRRAWVRREAKKALSKMV